MYLEQNVGKQAQAEELDISTLSSEKSLGIKSHCYLY